MRKQKLQYDFSNIEKIKEDILVIYQGGGYDGCIWEWNAFAIKKNKFYNLITSGTMGIENPEQIERILKNNTYDIYKFEDIYTFISDYNKYVAYKVIKAINDIDYIKFPCSECSSEVDIEDITFFDSDYHSENPICSECYSLNTCSYCGSEVEQENQIYDNELGIYGCKCCIENQINSEIKRLSNNQFIVGDKNSIDIANKIEKLNALKENNE